MDGVIQILGTAVVFLLLIVFPLVAAPYLVRRFGGAPGRAAEGALACPRCGSAVVRLEGNRVTPYPGYECRACDVRMRPPGTRTFYVVVVTACAVLLAMSAVVSWEEGRVVLIPCALTVGAYAVYQLLRPVPVARRPRDHRE